jgi:hypothetical protein
MTVCSAYFLYEDPKEMQIMKPYAPLGILYLCSHLRQHGFEVDVFDTTFSNREALFQHLRTETPTVLGIYANLMTRSNAIEIMAVARKAGWRVVVGGPEPGAYAQEYLEAGAEFVVFGEGEATLQELLTALRDRAERTDPTWRSKIAGVAYLDEFKQFHQNAPRGQIADLDAQPWPARQAIDIQRYVDTWRTHHRQGSVNFITARGCPYKCRWCSHQVYGQTHRRRNPVKVVDELEWLIGKYTPDIAWVSDDVFTINHQWLTAPSQQLKIANRDLGTIESIGRDGTMRLRLDDERKVEFSPQQHPHIDHGYAVTSYSSQGQTAERVLVNVDTELAAKDLLNSRMAYVSISRGQWDAQIFTDNLAKLPQALGHDVSHQSAYKPEQAMPALGQKIAPSSERVIEQSMGYGLGL